MASPFGLPRGASGLIPGPMPNVSVPTAQAPVFDQPPPQAAPMTPTPMVPPFAQPPMPQQAGGSPSFVGKALPILAAVLAGRRDPAAIGAGLAAYMRGQDLKRQETENAEDRARRKQMEQAEFYSRALANAQQFDDPIAFEQWRAAITPMAEVYGVNPQVFTFSDQKKAEKSRKEAQSIVEMLRKTYRDDIDDPAWRAGKATTVNGVHVTLDDLYRMADVPPVLGQAGEVVAPKKKPTDDPNATPNTDYSRFLSRWATDHGKTLQTLTSTEETQARKEFGQADDAARSGPDPSIAANRRFTMEQRLVGQWDKANTPYKEMRRQLGLMETGIKRFREGDKNGGSQAVLVTFQKILDPTSVVRESEYARSASGVSFIQRMEGYADRLAKGGAGVPEDALAEMVQTAREFLTGMEGYNNGLRGRIDRTATEYQLDPKMIFDDAVTGVTEPPPDAPASTAPRPRIKSITPVRVK